MKPIFGQREKDRATFMWGGRLITCDLHLWTAPDNTSLLIGVSIPCPSCDYPMYVKASDQTCEVQDNQLTVRQVILCPGHWAETDEYGNFNTNQNGNLERVKCGWSGVIAKGEAHQISCPKVRGQQCECGEGGQRESA